jgi:hypothetical protein
MLNIMSYPALGIESTSNTAVGLEKEDWVEVCNYYFYQFKSAQVNTLISKGATQEAQQLRQGMMNTNPLFFSCLNQLNPKMSDVFKITLFETLANQHAFTELLN